MSYFDRHSHLFRFLFGLLSAYLFVLGAITFYQLASRPTDENLFTNPPSNLYVTREIPATLKSNTKGDADGTVRVGDLILRAAKTSVETLDELRDALAGVQESQVDLEILRLSTGEKRDYRVSKDQLTGESLRDLGPTAQVIDVTSGGASDRAGMLVGDLILRINGKNFKNSMEADRILAEGQIGKALVYDVLRDNQVLSLHVTIAAFGVPFTQLVLVLSGLLFLSVGAFLGLARPRLIAARMSGLTFLAFGYFVMIFLGRHGYAVSMFDKVRDLTMVVAVFLAMPFSIHSGHYFPLARPELIARKWVRWGAYGLAVLGVVATFVFGNFGFFGGLIALFLYSILALGLFRKQASEEYKRLNKVVKNASILVGVVASMLGIFLWSTGRQQNMGYIGLCLILIPLAHLYTIGRYRLLGLDLRIRRNVQYILVTTVWVVALGILAFRVLLWLQGAEFPIPNIQLTASSIEVLDTPMQPQQRVWLEKGILMLLSVLVVYISWKIAQGGQRLIDKSFFRSQYDYRRAANELADVMATKLSMIDLARGTVEKLAGLLQLKRVGVLFFRNQKACCCQEVQGFDGAAWAEFCVATDAELTAALQQLETESSIELLPAPIKEEFRKNGFLYVSAIRSKDRLVGALLVGEKRSEAPFHQEDLDFLGAVARQAAVAIENAFLYEELAEKERLKHELAIARRIQLASLPQQTPHIEGLEIAGTSQPAMEVGGDYFDYLNGEAGKLTVIMGDVSGKGTSAALYMSKVQGILRSLHAFGLSPRDLFVRTNRLLCNDLEKSSFVTAINGSFDTHKRSLVLARAGHLPLYRYVASTGRVEKITPKGLGLGLESTELFSSELEERELTYQKNDVFIFTSDGVTEAESDTGAQFGEDGLMKLLAQHSSEHAQAILQHIMNAVSDFAGGREQHDDQTVVVVKAD